MCNCLIGQFLYPMKQNYKKTIPKHILKELHLETPKLTKKYTQKLSVLLNSNEADYNEKRKKINKLIIKYDDDYKVRLTEPSAFNKERSISVESRNSNPKHLLMSISGNQTKSHCCLKQTNKYQIESNKKHLNIPEFYIKEEHQVKNEAKRELDNYFLLNNNNNTNPNPNPNKLNTPNPINNEMIIFYKKLKQHHKVADRINSILAEGSISKVPNMSEVFQIIQKNKILKSLGSPKQILKPNKELAENSQNYIKSRTNRDKSRPPSHLIQNPIQNNTVFNPYESNNDIMRILIKKDCDSSGTLERKRRKIKVALPDKQVVLTNMNKQNEELSVLAERCRQVYDDNKVLILRKTKRLVTKEIRNYRSLSTNIAYKESTNKIRLSSIG